MLSRKELLELFASLETSVAELSFPEPDDHRVYADSIDLIYRRPAVRELLQISLLTNLLQCENDAPLFGIATGHLMFVGFRWMEGGELELTLRVAKRLMVAGFSIYRTADLSPLGGLLRRHEAALN